MFPEISVIIPTYNRRAMVCEAIASVIAQRGANFELVELIVVDDGSTDDTWRELEQTAAAANLEQGCLTMRIARTDNRGVAAARNAGVALASAPLIAFLDSDDLWMPYKLERQLAFMRAHREINLAQTEEIWMRGGRRVNPGLRHHKRAGDIFLDSLRTCLISPSAVMMRTALFRDRGGFDERMAAAEDYDFWLRILAGNEVGLLPEPLVTRRAGHAGQLSATVPAIDRFRILALMKLLAGDNLDAPRRQAVCAVLGEKCAIYAQGLRRRGREVDAALVSDVAMRASNSWREPDGTSIHDSMAPMIAIIVQKASGVVPEASGAVHQASGVVAETFP